VRENYCWLAGASWLVLVLCEREILLAGCSEDEAYDNQRHLVRDGCGSVGKQLKGTNIVIPMNSMLTVNSMNYSKFSTLASNLA